MDPETFHTHHGAATQAKISIRNRSSADPIV
jgi:hypothetical protein